MDRTTFTLITVRTMGGIKVQQLLQQIDKSESATASNVLLLIFIVNL